MMVQWLPVHGTNEHDNAAWYETTANALIDREFKQLWQSQGFLSSVKSVCWPHTWQHRRRVKVEHLLDAQSDTRQPRTCWGLVLNYAALALQRRAVWKPASSLSLTNPCPHAVCLCAMCRHWLLQP